MLEAGLREQLGDDYEEALDKLPQTKPTRSGRRTLPLGNTVARRRYVEKTNVVSYGPHGRANLADIWRRHDLPRDGKAPVLVQVPGGAWVIGMRRPQAYPLMSHLAARGWVCVSIGYRVSPRHTWPDHIVDVKRALAWVKQHIAEYGGDPDFIAITGGSAGGHLSSLAALTPNDPQFQPGFEDVDTRVQAAVPFYGIYDFTRFDKSLHPMMPGLLIKSIIKQSPRPTDRRSKPRRRSTTSMPTPRRSSSCTAATTRWPTSNRRAPSSKSCVKPARSRCSTPNYLSPNTLSTSSARCAPRTPRWPSSNSSPRSTPDSARSPSRNR